MESDAEAPRFAVVTGIYYDRGELFSYLSAGAGAGFNGPFGVTLSEPFVTEIAAPTGATIANPFPNAASAPPASARGVYRAAPQPCADHEELLPGGESVRAFCPQRLRHE